MPVIIAAHNKQQEFGSSIRHGTIEITCYGTQLGHYEFTGSLEAIGQCSFESRRLGMMRRSMSMKTLMSAAHAAGYAMAAEEVAEPRAGMARVPSTAIVVRPVQRGVVASAHRSMRRMWLHWFAEHWAHRAAA